MTPKEYMKDLRRSLSLKDVLTEKQVLQSEEFLDHGFEFIGKRLEENYDDMGPEATKIANRLSSFLFVLLEHSFNPSMVLKMEKVFERES